MPTYTYETVPAAAGVPPRRFEVRQSINAAPLTHDPESGEPVRRVLSGGLAVLTRSSRSSAATDAARAAGPACGLGDACGCLAN
jgi:predicted nucleic acid-binding Zn ribbon protein